MLEQIAKELNVTPVLDKIQDYGRNWLQHTNRMPHNKLMRTLKILQTNWKKKTGGNHQTGQ
jgi:hypothetical protein